MISAIYRTPYFSIKEGQNKTENRKQHTGIRQGCPLSPYLFIILLTVMMKDIMSSLTPDERRILDEGKRHHEITKNLFYADDTIIMTATAEAAQVILQTIQREFIKYGMKLNQAKCEHIRLNAIHRIQYENGEEVPIARSATYLGVNIQPNGDHKNEIQSIINAAWITVMKLDIFWRKAPVTIKWKLRVLDAVINSKVLYGTETLVTAQSDYNKLDAFQIRIFRKMLRIKHSYWSHVKNEEVMNTAKERAAHFDKNIEIIPLSTRLKQRIVKFYGHIIRSDPNTDQIRQISINDEGDRIKVRCKKRTGRPKLKWYNSSRQLVIDELHGKQIYRITN